MSGLVWAGALLSMLGGIVNGSFTAPMKFTRGWAWENTWLVFSAIGLLCIPVAVALYSVPDLLAVYRSSNPTAMFLAMVFGFGWGVGCVLFGLGIQALGMALGFGIILGLTAALGSLIPLLVLSRQALLTARGISVLVGLAIVLVGIAVCARAGSLKSDATPLAFSRYRTGLAICVGSGVFNAMLNLALAFGAPVAQAAMEHGATANNAQSAIWALAVSAGALANIAYSLFLLFRNDSWRVFASAGGCRNLWLAVAMGALWMAGVSIYGAGAANLGKLGAVMGWPLFMSMVIVAGNVWGFATSEWNQAPRSAVRMNLAGVALLILAISVISLASLL